MVKYFNLNDDKINNDLVSKGCVDISHPGYQMDYGSCTLTCIHHNHNRSIHKCHTFFFFRSCAFFKLSFAFLNIATTSVLPITLALCSPTVSICIFLAYGLLIFLTFATVALASAGVANLMLTVSLGFSSVYSLLSLPFGFLPVPTLGSLLFFLDNFLVDLSISKVYNCIIT